MRTEIEFVAYCYTNGKREMLLRSWSLNSCYRACTSALALVLPEHARNDFQVAAVMEEVFIRSHTWVYQEFRKEGVDGLTVGAFRGTVVTIVMRKKRNRKKSLKLGFVKILKA